MPSGSHTAHCCGISHEMMHDCTQKCISFSVFAHDSCLMADGNGLFTRSLDSIKRERLKLGLMACL